MTRRMVPRGNRGLLDFERDFDEFFEPFARATELFNRGLMEGYDIKADIKETDDGYQLICEVPGFNKEDISVNYENNILTISAEKEESDEQEEEGYLRKERRSGRISRSFRIDNVNPENIEAKLENGVLTVDIPSEEEKETQHKIDIK